MLRYFSVVNLKEKASLLNPECDWEFESLSYSDKIEAF
jgi:hypothetical protein